jgi:hypothetical protein
MFQLSRLGAVILAGSDEVTRVASSLASAATAVTFTLIGSARAGRPAARLRPDAWSAQRLKETLGARLRGQRVLVVANREPIIHEWEGNKVVVRHPASGLVTALEPVLRACSGVWVAHGGGSADRDAADQEGGFGGGGQDVVLPPARVADAGTGERLLLRLCERGGLAALPSGACTANLPA